MKLTTDDKDDKMMMNTVQMSLALIVLSIHTLIVLSIYTLPFTCTDRPVDTNNTFFLSSFSSSALRSLPGVGASRHHVPQRTCRGVRRRCRWA